MNRIFLPLKYFLVFSGASLIGFKIGSLKNKDQPRKQLSPSPIQSPIASFRENTIQAPIKRVHLQNLKVLYSTFHKIPLASHLYLDKTILQKNEFIGSLKNQHADIQLDLYLPQYGNTGIWKTFQNYTTSLLQRQKCESLETITGPIITKNRPYKDKNGHQISGVFQLKANIGIDGQTIPDKMYKIIKCNQKNNEYYASGFIFKNMKEQNNNNLLKNFEEPIQQIENQTGLSFHFDQFNQQSNKIGSLSQFDKQVLSSTKYAFDAQYYKQKLRKTTNFDEFRNIWDRNLQQQLGFKCEHFVSEIAELAKVKIQSLQKDNKINYCSKLQEYIKVEKSLTQFECLQNFQEKIFNNELASLNICLQEGNSYEFDQIKRILNNLYIKNKQVILTKITEQQSISMKQLKNISKQQQTST